MAVLGIALSGSARVVQHEVDFGPSAMSWRAHELRGLTNVPPERLAAEVKKFRESGGKGDPEALLNLAVLYERGLGFITNHTEAARLVRQAAELGFAPAQSQLGLYFSDGIGVTQDAVEAFRWWSKAAAQGYPPAEYLVGYCYLNGEGIGTNFTKANEYFRKAAEHKSPAAMHNLAVSYSRGRAVETNIDEAIRLFRNAADLGSYRSATAAAALMTQSPRTRQEGLRLARWAAEHDDTRAQSMVAQFCVHGLGMPRNVEEGLRWIRKASGRGDLDADVTLAEWYLDGTVQPVNYRAALFLAEPAAKAGHAGAQNFVGLMHCDGMGMPTNFDAAIKWFRLSSDQNYPVAWLNLGRMYRNGWGVPKSLEEAFRCDLRAAELGSPIGQTRTALSLLRRGGATNDQRGALKWLIEAAAQSEPQAISLLSDWIFSRRLVGQDLPPVIDAVRTAAEKGSFAGAALYGRMHLHGVIRPLDEAAARANSIYAATNGLPRAATYLGIWLLRTNSVSPSAQEGWKWIEYAAERDESLAEAMLASRGLQQGKFEAGTNWLWRGVQKGHGNCMYYLADLMIGSTRPGWDAKSGWELMQRAADAGHAPAMTRIADRIMAAAEPVGKALLYYENAADQQWPRALAALGFMYCTGKNVPIDEKKGWYYLMRAAVLQEPRASYTWGLALLRGYRGVTNVQEAAQLLLSSAEQGFPNGQNAYGYMLAQGDAGPRDIVEAWKWYELAAAAGDKNAIANMEALRREITPQQIGFARKRAEAFRPVLKGTRPDMFPPGQGVASR